MSDQVVARRYVGALYSVAKEKRISGEFAAALEQVSRKLEQDEDFRRVIYHQLIPVREKQKIMDMAFPGFNPLLKNFLNLVLEKRRERALPKMAAHFRQMVDRDNRVLPVELRSAVSLPDDVTTAIKERLEDITKQNVRLETRVDPGILGGVVVRMGDRVLDASLKKKLELMALHLKRA